MKTRKGQIIVFLALILVAIAVLTLMNVGTYIGVSARNTSMNAGDAAALAVAAHQGKLINKIGKENIDHLKAALNDDEDACERIVMSQLRTCFLGPLEGLRIGNEYAMKNGASADEEFRKFLLSHVDDVLNFYLYDQRLFPPPWTYETKGGREISAWEEYADALRLQLSEPLYAFPANTDFVNALADHMLLARSFYAAIAGRSWCWFKFNAPGLLENYSSFRDWTPLEGLDPETRQRKCCNSEIYSLNLTVRKGSAIALLGVELISRLTGEEEEKILSCKLLKDAEQRWFFYDTEVWRDWQEIDPSCGCPKEKSFPGMGFVKDEYDVKGCAAVCRVKKCFSTVVDESTRCAEWLAAAKPFGTVEGLEGGAQVVTSYGALVTDAFSDARLVALSTVNPGDFSTADPDFMRHTRDHLVPYLLRGPDNANGCWYCRQLVLWEQQSFRHSGSRWLKLHGHECVRSKAGGLNDSRGGGSTYAH